MEVPTLLYQRNATWKSFLTEAKEKLGKQESVEWVPDQSPEETLSLSQSDEGVVVASRILKYGDEVIKKTFAVAPQAKNGFIVASHVSVGSFAGVSGYVANKTLLEDVWSSTEGEQAQQKGEQFSARAAELTAITKLISPHKPGSGGPCSSDTWILRDGSQLKKFTDSDSLNVVGVEAGDFAKFQPETGVFTENKGLKETRVMEVDGRFVMMESDPRTPEAAVVQGALQEVLQKDGSVG